MPDDPGKVSAKMVANGFVLGNDALKVTYSANHSSVDGWGGKFNDSPPSLFQISLKDGRKLAPSNMKLVAPFRVLEVRPRGGKTSDPRFTGLATEAVFEDPRSGLRIRCRLLQRNHTHYLREELALSSSGGDVAITHLELIKLPLGKGARVVGTVPGSPISNGRYFVGLEHPMGENRLEAGLARTGMSRKVPLRAGQTVTYSAVVGAEAPGQERRAFASYVELERARPYAPFLHYNSWYDLGYFNRFNEPECLDRIHAFGEALTLKRDVRLSSFLFDDGWDDTSNTWQFHSGFPSGFASLKEAAGKYGAAPGVWLSPWGGYGKPREERLATGKKRGLEIDEQGFALSGPKYYALFHQVCLRMVTEFGINQFKFDGTGSPDKQYPGSEFDSDFDAAIQLIRDLRKANPSLFVNLTTGTWPSPFWTRYADSIWRGGSDHDFAGVGPDRERWITYRDSDTFHNVVNRGPLYPLNSLMLHGLIFAQHAHNLSNDPSGAFLNEIRSYFGNGTQLQEMYITPTLLSEQNWDDLAQAANWSNANLEVLRDSHWIGGDPERLEVYGWASWSTKKSIVVLRNPSNADQAFALQPNQVLEIPEFAQGAMRFSPAFGDKAVPPFTVANGATKVVKLKPFQVLVLEGGPK